MVGSIGQNLTTTMPLNANGLISTYKNNFVVNKPIEKNETAIAVLDPKGHLVRENIVKRIIHSPVPYVQSIKNFGKALKGEGSDYTVGKLNDTALKMGSLGIAGALAIPLASPSLKAMEFVGFTTWFLSMAVWPKVFIGGPIKALYGFNPNQEYVDSYDKRKRFFEDPQYLTWDLWNDKEIQKIGDRLGIPKDIKNRREAVQDKMKQIAIQYNTLWMVTAGFSTPILSSLMADQLAKPTKKIIEGVRVNLNTPEYAGVLKGIKGNLKGDAAIKQSPYDKAIDGIVSGASYVIKQVSDRVGNYKSDTFEFIQGNSVKLDKKLAKELKTLLDTNPEDEKVKAFFKKHIDLHSSNDFKGLLDNEMSRILAMPDAKEKAAHLSNFFAEAKDVANRRTGFFKAYNTILGEKAESTIANIWSDAPKEIAKALGMKGRILDSYVAKPNSTKNIIAIARHLESLSAEEKQKALEKVINLVAKLDAKVDAADYACKDNLMNAFDDSCSGFKKSLYDAFEKELNAKAGKLQGIDVDGVTSETFVSLRTKNFKSSFYNIINIIDMAMHPREGIKLKEGMHGINIDNLYNKVPIAVLSDEELKVLSEQDPILVKDINPKPLLTQVQAYWADLHPNSRELCNRKIPDFEDKYINLKNNLRKFAEEIIKDVDRTKNNEQKGKLLGKTAFSFLDDAVQEMSKYRKWVGAVGALGGLVLAGTWFAITRFGKTNEYNTDVYKRG